MFCALEGSGRVLLENELALCIADAFPVTLGHSLVIPRRHVADGLDLHQPEWNAAVELLKRRCEQLSAKDASMSEWNVGLNSGETAGRRTRIGRRTDWLKPMMSRSLPDPQSQEALQIVAHRRRRTGQHHRLGLQSPQYGCIIRVLGQGSDARSRPVLWHRRP